MANNILPVAQTTALISFPFSGLVPGPLGQVLQAVAIIGIVCTFAQSLAQRGLRESLGPSVATVYFVLFYGTAYAFTVREQDPDKLRQFLLVIALFGVMLSIALAQMTIRSHLLIAFSIIGGLAVALMVIDPSQYSLARVTFEDTNPIWIGRLVGYLGLAGIGLFVKRLKKIGLPLIAVSIWAIALTGSRGPLVALSISLMFGVFVLSRRDKSQVLVASIACLIFAFALMNLLDLTSIVGDLRLLPEEDVTARYRVTLMQYSLSVIANSPTGLGVGGFDFAGFTYPHNIFLEFLVEWGWLCGGVAVALIAFGSYRILKNRHPSFDMIKLALLYELVNASTSGDVTSPRLLYAIVLLGLLPRRFVLPRRAAETTGFTLAQAKFGAR